MRLTLCVLKERRGRGRERRRRKEEEGELKALAPPPLYKVIETDHSYLNLVIYKRSLFSLSI
jgi:hypothetical protein